VFEFIMQNQSRMSHTVFRCALEKMSQEKRENAMDAS